MVEGKAEKLIWSEQELLSMKKGYCPKYTLFNSHIISTLLWNNCKLKLSSTVNGLREQVNENKSLFGREFGNKRINENKYVFDSRFKNIFNTIYL